MEEIIKNIKTILKCPLFAEMDEEKAGYAVRFFNGSFAAYKKGEIIHRPYTEMNRFGLVISGSVEAILDDFDGNRMIMAEVVPGKTFGEALCWLQAKDSPVYIYASDDTEVLWMDPANLYTCDREELTVEMEKRFTSLLAERTLALNSRIQSLSRSSIRGRLMFYLSEKASEAGNRTFRIPLNREDLAAYLGVNRTALSRELSRMRDEGIIEFSRSTFTVLKGNIRD